MRPLQAPAVEGAFASYNPRFQIQAGPGGLVGEPNGVAIGRFGWADLDTGLVYSSRQAAENLLGFVYRTPPGWRRTYWDAVRRAFISRGGFELTLARRGDFWMRFPAGAYPGQNVWANPLDGTALALPRNVVSWTADSTVITADSTLATADGSTGYELTPWQVVSYAAPGDLAIITSWSFFTP